MAVAAAVVAGYGSLPVSHQVVGLSGGLGLLPGWHGDAAVMRVWSVLLFGGTLLVTSGCTNSILGVLLAPEGVVAGAATGLAEVGASTLSGASLDELSDLGSTITELDRILEENPDAVNAESLRGLREQLKEGKSANTGPDQRIAAKEPPRPRRPSDTRLPLRKGDNLTIRPPGESIAQRRPAPRPDTLPDGSSLQAEQTPVHTMSLQPVRLVR